MQVLVTGGNGYLGGRIVECLTEVGVSVKVGARDIFINEDSLKSACKDITVIIHLAAMNAQECAKDPEAALLVNGLNSLKLLKAAECMGVSKFIYFSTAHVYGMPLEGFLNEESLPRPLHPYSITHRLAEDYVLEADIGRVSGIVFRLTNAVGSPIREGANCWMLVVNDLCRQVVVDKKIILHSEASVERDYVPISSVIEAVLYAIENDNLDSGIYNISSGVAFSLRDLTDLIVERSVDILGFRPTVHFPQGSESKTKEINQLNISNSKLKDYGFVIAESIVDEIDKLLLNCQKWFC